MWRRSGAALTTAEKVVIWRWTKPYRPGIEFDYCCVHACYALAEAGYETIMINCGKKPYQQIMIHLTGSILSR